MISYLYQVPGQASEIDEPNGTFSGDSGLPPQLVDTKQQLVADTLDCHDGDLVMLMRPAEFAKAKPFRDFLSRGIIPLYHQDTVNHCPACGHKHWHIGRSTAECAFCATALPLAVVAAQPMEPRFTSHATKTLKAA
jgi:hypothetical protein